MEYIDVLDEKGNKTGEIRSKDEIHAQGLWHRTVHVWFVNFQDEILFQLRSKNKSSYPGLWDASVGGHISSGEGAVATAIRETGEELGVTIEEKDLKCIGTVPRSAVMKDGSYIDNEFKDVYVVRTNLLVTSFHADGVEVEKVEFISAETLTEWMENKNPNLFPHPNEYELLLEYLKTLQA